MKSSFLRKEISRREMFAYFQPGWRAAPVLAHVFSTRLLGASAVGYPQQEPSPADLLADMRARFNAAPLVTHMLGEDVTMLSGPGGSVVVLNGPDGKFVVDTVVAPAWPRLKEALDTLGNAPVTCVIDTHWHFDHTDNNAHLECRKPLGTCARKHDKAHVGVARSAGLI